MPVVEMRDVWTFADLEALELEDWRRYEIVDGALYVSPRASVRHEFVSAAVRSILDRAAPADWAVIGPIAIDLRPSYRIPDLVVVPTMLRRNADRSLVEPTEVGLAVEIVSPGSVTMDRVTKPAQYAAAGIPNFWRVETEPLGITAYRLESGAAVYTEVGSWAAGETARIAEPFPVEIEIDRLG